MQLDPRELRQHYASLSDEALLEIDRADLVDVAQMIFDEEVRERKLGSRRDMRQPLGTRTTFIQPEYNRTRSMRKLRSTRNGRATERNPAG
jgi:hypothetical protein